MKIKSLLKRVANGWILKPFKLRIYSTEAFGRDLEQDITRLLGSPAVMFDVGANVGQTVKAWSQAFPGATIHSFEPVKRLYDSLVAVYGQRAVCNQLGVGSEAGTIRINYGKHDVSHSFVHDDEGRGGEEVEVITLDGYCHEHGIDHIGVLKVDVEGFEYEVVKGAESLLRNHRVDLVLVELGMDPDGYYVFYPRFAERMRNLGYHTLGFYDQTSEWDGSARLLFCNVLFARDGLKFTSSNQSQ